MNVSNLQLQGLYLAIASINNTLVAKGIISREEIDLALRRAEQSALGDDRLREDLTPASRDAVAFPARLLLLANNSASETDVMTFSELAKMVGQTKGHYPDEA
ncbi:MULTISPECIES: hypothetical protein [unclassified Devosia]|uniref:hypothetical protein n=1 Tax=unclassified Devosia TaxID=196773 RepID=UPI00145D2F63|nr:MULTISPECIES: hypothetical protein [unclassified Devosia]MBJ6987763.1 hypothetical protein [Devosia sp. MC521]QMW62435.1 hypothetical protein H4N61_16190 [Devosia sp. MC521]